MGTPAYNLVIVKGDKKDLDEFEKKAYKSESEAFCFKQLLPLPDYLAVMDQNSDEVLAYSTVVYGSKWVAAFGILIDRSDEHLKYYFNSKYTRAQLFYLAMKYSNLSFIQAFVELEIERCGLREYVNGEKTTDISIPDKNLDWQIASYKETYPYIEELLLKMNLFRKTKPLVFREVCPLASDSSYLFHEFFPVSVFLRENESFYDSLYMIECDLENRDLYYAKHVIYYNFSTNSLLSQLQFIRQNILSAIKRNAYALKILEFIRNNNSIPDLEKMNIFIFAYRHLDLEQYLITIVKEYIEKTIEKIKLYLEQPAEPDSEPEGEYEYLTQIFNPYAGVSQIEFREWRGLEEDQESFHEWMRKFRSAGDTKKEDVNENLNNVIGDDLSDLPF